MSVYKKNNKFVSYLIILAGLFILVLVTKEQIVLLQENKDLIETNIQLRDEKKDNLNILNRKRDELKKSKTEINKYLIDIKEDELIDYIYSNIENINDTKGVSIINSLSISEPVETEIGFKETNININLTVPNEKKLKKILDFLTNTNSKYNFFITSFSFPYGKESDFKVTIPLKVLHK